MKNILTIILSVITIFSFSQTKLDSLIINKINNYRDSLKVNQFEFDKVCYKSANLQSTYLAETNREREEKSFVIGHSNTRPGQQNLSDRYLISGGKKYKHIGENVVFFCVNINKKDSLSSLDKIAEQSIRLWKKSPKHHKLMISPDFKYAACSVKLEPSKHKALKNWTTYYVYATLVMSDTKN